MEMFDKNMAIEALVQHFTEDQLRAAYEAAKTKSKEIQFQKYKQNSQSFTCSCGKRAAYIARPERVQYEFQSLVWDDEAMRLELGYTSEGRDYNNEQPGDDDDQNPSIDDFVAFARCSGECDWFIIRDNYTTDRLIEQINSGRR